MSNRRRMRRKPYATMKRHVLEKLLALVTLINSRTEFDVIEAAEFVIKNFRTNSRRIVMNETLAHQTMYSFVQSLIQLGYHEWAAKVIWPETIFTTEPASVKQIWEAIPKTSELLCMGAGSMGKSYTIGAWLFLDWLADPEYTCIKVVSLTAAHAKRNVFAHMKNLAVHSRVTIPCLKEDMITSDSIMVNDNEKQGIHLVAIPKGETGAGRLRGFHPEPRPVPHPKYGTHSRVRAVLDEAEEISHMVWEDIDNLLLSKDGVDLIKVIAATNPKDINSTFAQKAEPNQGWDSINMDTAFAWNSKGGFKVVRVDGAQSENVQQKKLVFNGLLTWEGYQRLLEDTDSPEYYTMARGWYPKKGMHMNIIPTDFVNRNVGTVQFTGPTIFCASADLALEGGDRAIMTIGRFGRAHGWQPKGGAPIVFSEPKIVVQIESFFELPKAETNAMTDNIMSSCKTLSIKPMWLGVDRTGNGSGVHDMLKIRFGSEVLGVDYGSGATDTRVLQEDSEKACDLYDGVVTELFFSVRKFLEFDLVKFSPYLKMENLRPELTGRRFAPKGKKIRVESKKDFKARGNRSPDYADSLTLLVHLIRMRGDMTASMLAIQPRQDEDSVVSGGVVDKLEFINFHE